MRMVRYDFPLPSAQCGALMGNGVTGVMLWGEGNRLNLTVGCASLWDHRGGMPWTPAQNFADIRRALEAGDMDEIRRIFAPDETSGVRQPTLIPVGRVAITLPEGARLLRYEQLLETGATRVFYAIAGQERSLEFFADMSRQDALAGRGVTDGMAVELLTSYELTLQSLHQWKLAEHSTLQEHGYQPPVEFARGTTTGFIQQMPADPSFALACRQFGDGSLTVTFRRGLRDAAELENADFRGFAAVASSSEEFFGSFWRDLPQVKCADPQLEQIYCHGLYKYAIMTNPAGVPPGLQGPWIEDDRLPPWQGDYHFNINVQMCMLPGLKAGKFANMRRFFDMLLSWKDKLRHNARCFVGIDDGYMLPHAVDDRATCMGSFWTGAIDHACAAWMAKMMFDYCDYSGDLAFLRDQVYDFMQGVMRVFQAMMETGPDGRLSLPVTVSPEYRGASIDAWGRDASFQLASVHQLAANILRAEEMLGLQPDAECQRIRRELPLFCCENQEIALWQGLLLEESHRHHSHLAGICPFEVIDPQAPEMREVMARSIRRWVQRGMGEWTGWCMPWASQIHSRCGNGNAAELILKIWRDCFNNAGGGSLHDARYKGFSVFAQIRGEVMQMDGSMGAVTAIQDQFMHVFDGELRIFYGIPEHHCGVSFHNMFAPGGLRVSGEIDDEGGVAVEVTATRPAELRLAVRGGATYRQPLAAGQTIRLRLRDGALVPE